MPLRLDTQDADFEAGFKKLLSARDEDTSAIRQVVADIIADVKARGDGAVFDYTQRFDSLELASDTIRVSKERIEQAHKDCDDEVIAALEEAAERLQSYHAKQMPRDEFYTDASGTQLGWKWSPLDSVGLYVPGGRASYPSSVLHNAIPARVAGVKRLVMVVPTPNGEMNPAILVAAKLAGVDDIYTIGGAQAIAALTFGTDSITPVDMIVGPGNAYVAEAKRQVFGMVGIDMIAGPSEILVMADDKNDPNWIAADLLSQAEHDPVAQSILITTNSDYADRVVAAVETTLEKLERKDIAGASWRDFGGVITVQNCDEAVDIANRIAPEHLELAIENPQDIAEKITHAGAIFLGRYSPEAIGDYVAGPSHVLPTSRTARFSSGLSVYHFVKKSSLIQCSEESIQRIGDKAHTLAEAEGLGAHALSVRYRIAQ